MALSPREFQKKYGHVTQEQWHTVALSHYNTCKVRGTQSANDCPDCKFLQNYVKRNWEFIPARKAQIPPISNKYKKNDKKTSPKRTPTPTSNRKIQKREIFGDLHHEEYAKVQAGQLILWQSDCCYKNSETKDNFASGTIHEIAPDYIGVSNFKNCNTCMKSKEDIKLCCQICQQYTIYPYKTVTADTLKDEEKEYASVEANHDNANDDFVKKRKYMPSLNTKAKGDIRKKRCESCGMFVHFRCGLYHSSVYSEWKTHFYCSDKCRPDKCADIRGRFASTISHTKNSVFIENELHRLLKEIRKERLGNQNTKSNEDLDISTIFVRELYSAYETEEFDERIKLLGYTENRIRAQKLTFCMFQRSVQQNTQDIALFIVYIIAYGNDAPLPWKGRAYISYVDSVPFFTPAVHRSDAFRSMIVGIIKWLKENNYKSMHLWVAPPDRGQEYVWLARPHQKKEGVSVEDLYQKFYSLIFAAANKEYGVGAKQTFLNLEDAVFSRSNAKYNKITDLPLFKDDIMYKMIFWAGILKKLNEKAYNHILPQSLKFEERCVRYRTNALKKLRQSVIDENFQKELLSELYCVLTHSPRDILWDINLKQDTTKDLKELVNDINTPEFASRDATWTWLRNLNLSAASIIELQYTSMNLILAMKDTKYCNSNCMLTNKSNTQFEMSLCETCNRWFHNKCEEFDGKGDFTCRSCKLETASTLRHDGKNQNIDVMTTLAGEGEDGLMREGVEREQDAIIARVTRESENGEHVRVE